MDDAPQRAPSRKHTRRGDSEHLLRQKHAVLDGNESAVPARLGAIHGDLATAHVVPEFAKKGWIAARTTITRAIGTSL